MEKTDQENQAMYILNESSQSQALNGLNDSSQVEASINELESNLTEPDPSTFANNTNNTTIKRKLFKSPRKKDWNLKKRKVETLKSSSSETDTVLAAIKQLDGIAERAQKLAQNNKKEDSFDQFGKYIASVLRDLPLKKACLLQQQMTNIIMNEIIENANQNAVHELQSSSSLQTN